MHNCAIKSSTFTKLGDFSLKYQNFTKFSAPAAQKSGHWTQFFPKFSKSSHFSAPCLRFFSSKIFGNIRRCIYVSPFGRKNQISFTAISTSTKIFNFAWNCSKTCNYVLRCKFRLIQTKKIELSSFLVKFYTLKILIFHNFSF